MVGFGVAGVVVLSGVAALGMASATERDGGGQAGAAPTVSCPTVADQLPAVPAQARAEVDRNLALLDTQIAEANQRLVTSQGEGGPNFIDNAILGPLEDKRVATINRIATAIGRNAARPAGLDALAPCVLNEGGDAGQDDAGDDGAGEDAAGEDAGSEDAAGDGAAGDGAADEGADAGADAGDDGAAAAPTVDCPTVADQLPAVPARARAEVDRNLALLDTQIAEANRRLVTSQGEGGPNFIDNAILGPLEDKRAATLDRIAIAIGRSAERPTGLGALAACALDPAAA
jgi:hypothetical protein